MAVMDSGGVVELVNDLLRRAVAAHASDVHFEPARDGLHVRWRVDALLREIDLWPAAVAPNVVARVKVLAGLLTYRTDIPQEGAIPAERGPLASDVRVATFPTVHGERVVLRLLGETTRVRTLEELGHDAALLAALRNLLLAPQGLLLVCGPAGSGKTTTLHAMLAHLQATRPGQSIIALEDPVEIRQDGITQVELEPTRGFTCAVALRSILRQDPQVLMIGEVRDAETAHLAIEAALTGHLLLSTLHSGSPVEALVRLREMGLPPYQLTSTIQGVLAQRLLRRTCRACAGAARPPAAHPAAALPCPRCQGTGFAGRSAIGRLVTLTPAVRAALLAGADLAALDAAAGNAPALVDAARCMLAAGETTAAEIERVLGSRV